MKKKNLCKAIASALLISCALPYSGQFYAAYLNQIEVSETMYATWNANTIYNTGDIVAYNGKLWKAQWYTTGEIPGTTGQWGCWQECGTAPTTPPTTPTQPGTYTNWNANTVYNTGDIVSYNGKNWIAGWYTIRETPGTTGEWGVWKEYTTVTPTPSTTPTESPTPSTTPTDMPTISAQYMKNISITTDCPSSVSNKKSGVTYGTMVHKTYYSKTTGLNRGVNILLPANYNTNNKYPVLYLLHGILGNEYSLTGDVKITEIVGNLIADGSAKDMIVVFPNMFATTNASKTAGFDDDSFAAYDNFINDLVNDLMPYMEKNYSIRTGREYQAIAGFSMGGRESLYIGFTRPDVFGYVMGIAPAPGLTPGRDYIAYHKGQLQENELFIKDKQYAPYAIMLCAGTKDSVVGTFPKSYHDIMLRNSVNHIWYELPGADHDNRTIQSGVYNFAKAIFHADEN